MGDNKLKMEADSSLQEMNSKPGVFNNWVFAGLLVFVVILFIIGVWFTDIGKKCMDSFKNTFSKKSGLKDLDIVVFISPTCPWCVKQLEMLRATNEIDNVKIVDKTTEAGLEEAKSFGMDKMPNPSFLSLKNKTTTIGYKETVSQLIEELGPNGSVIEQSEPSSNVEDLRIVLFTRDTCSWCAKAKADVEKAGISEKIQMIDLGSEENEELYKEIMNAEPAGVPVWKSLKTGKVVNGYKPVDIIIEELS